MISPSRHRFSSLALLILVAAIPATGSAKPKKPEIHVSTMAELYAAVQPANANTVVRLAAGTYTLDVGTRLELPAGMELVGVKRRHGRESKIVVQGTLAGNGAIRLGDRNAVRWITAQAPIFAPARESGLGQTPAVTALIDVNIPPAQAGVGMSAEVSDCRLIGATRGIRVQHLGVPATSPFVGRTSVVRLEHNETIDQGDGFGFGVQVQNFANNSVLDVTLRNNRFSGTRYGLFMVSITGPDNALNIVRSQNNVYSNNIAGAAIFGGRDAVNPPFLNAFTGATNSRSEFISIKDDFINNVGNELATLGASGGLAAVGGLRTATHSTQASGNSVLVSLCKARFSGNRADGLYRDLTVTAGLGTAGNLPFGSHHADVVLNRVKTARPNTFVFAASVPGQPLGEAPNIIDVDTDHGSCHQDDDDDDDDDDND